MLLTIVRGASQLKTFFKTVTGITVHTSSRKVRTAGQTSLLANYQMTMTLKLKVKPGWVSVLKSTTTSGSKEDLFVDPFTASYLLGL